MNEPFFKNAPLDVSFFGGDPEILRKAQTVKLSIGGDKGLADRLNDALLQRKSGIYGLSVEKEVMQFRDSQLTSGR